MYNFNIFVHVFQFIFHSVMNAKITSTLTINSSYLCCLSYNHSSYFIYHSLNLSNIFPSRISSIHSTLPSLPFIMCSVHLSGFIIMPLKQVVYSTVKYTVYHPLSTFTTCIKMLGATISSNGVTAAGRWSVTWPDFSLLGSNFN